MRIDVHAHYFPEAYLDLLQYFGSEATDIARHRGASGSSEELEARLELMDSAQAGSEAFLPIGITRVRKWYNAVTVLNG